MPVSAPPLERAPAQTPPGQDALTLFYTPEDMHRTWLAAIDQAQTSIFMEMFHLTDMEVVNKLRAGGADAVPDVRMLARRLTDAGLMHPRPRSCTGADCPL